MIVSRSFRPLAGLLGRAGSVVSIALTCAAAPDQKQNTTGIPTIVFQDKRIRESSGLARSLLYPNAVWTHNDSGDSARLFLVDLKTGATLNDCKLDLGRPRDWEDMASYNKGDRPMLVVGDIGSNNGSKRVRRLHFIDEPIFPPASKGKTLDVRVWATTEFQFEDGYPDCEAIGVNAANGVVYLITKSRGGDCGVYELDLPERSGVSRGIARRVATLKLPMATAMDIHPDGKRMLVLGYFSVWEFRREESQTWRETLSGSPRILFVPPLGKQVEAICYAGRDNLFHFSSEGKRATLWTRSIPNAGGASRKAK